MWRSSAKHSSVSLATRSSPSHAACIASSMVSGQRLASSVPVTLPPQAFDRVEFGGVGGQAFDAQPAAAGGDEGGHVAAAVAGQSVPVQGGLGVPAEVGVQLAEEVDEVLGSVGARLGGEHQLRGRPVRAVTQRRGHAHPLPVELVPQHRGLSPGCPGGPHHRGQRDTGFVLEDDPRPAASRAFFTRGQSSLNQRAIASSSRSAARRAGRCTDQPSSCSSRHT